MELPDYWLHRPVAESGHEASFDSLFARSLAQGPNPLIHYDLPVPKWQFLCHLADHTGLALHGSGDAAITEFEPRQANDLSEFGNRKAVYAASDGLWAMFFAVVDRTGVVVTNACIRLVDPAGRTGEPRYFFAVSRDALARRPWRSGTVYLLPKEGFVGQDPMRFGDHLVSIAQLASVDAVAPLARVTVTPEDFPFLADVRGLDDARLAEYSQALMTGQPLPG
ncbi:MAG: hypothetical protein HZA58_01720 [Acidimicrobiia bacterium]|nr:hypothetical protein [Acidimicrobiia bacterium]